MKNIKPILSVCLMAALSATPIFAEEQMHKHEEYAAPTGPAPQPQNFEQMKKMILQNTDHEIIMLQQFKACMTNAQDKAAADVCRQNRKQTMMQFHQDHKIKREKKHEARENDQRSIKGN